MTVPEIQPCVGSGSGFWYFRLWRNVVFGSIGTGVHELVGTEPTNKSLRPSEQKLFKNGSSWLSPLTLSWNPNPNMTPFNIRVSGS